MNKQKIEFAVQQTNSIVTRIGKSYITHPAVHFKGNSIKWYDDRPKQLHINKNG